MSDCIGPTNIIPNNNQVVLQDANRTITVIDNNCCTNVTVTQPVTCIVQVNTPGPQGPAGSGGGSNIDTGSFATTGSNIFIGNQIITGSVDITGSLTVNTVNVGQNTLNFVDSNNNILTSLSVSGNNLVLSSGSFLASQGGLTGSLLGTASYAITASYALNGGGGNVDTNAFVTTSSFNAFTSSINNATSSFVTNSQTSSFVTNSQTSSFVTNSQTSSFVLNSQTSSFVTNSQTSSFTTTSSFDSFTSSINSFTSSINSFTSSINATTGSFVTTSSFNAFTSSINNATGSFLTIGSSGTSQTISGSLIINQNLTVLGSSSITYVTSSQLNIGTNLITVNTATPAVRFGGLAVYDSGSTGTGRTGSILWDSQNDVWVYSNPSGASYDGAMMLVGPRNSTGLGNEVGINSGYAAVGDGSHHMTSSAIYSSGSLIRLENNTQITGSLIVSAGITGSFSGSVFGYVSNSSTSSFVTNSQTSSFVTNSQTSSFVLNSQTSSMTVATASYVTGSIFTGTNSALSSSYASNAENVYSALVTGGTSYGIVLAATGATGYKTLSNTANSTISVIPNVGRIAATSMTASVAFNATASAIGFVGTASNAVSSSYALTASYALTSAGGGTVSTASLLTTASATNNVITFTKGDASTFTVTVATGSGGGAAFPFTGSAQITGSLDVIGSITQTGSIITSGKYSGGAGYSGGGGINSNYRFTNAQPSDTTDWLFSVYNGPASVGTPAFFIDPTNRFLTFTVSNNANRFIARAGISIETSNNVAGSEDGTLRFFTQTGGANMAERMRISSTGRVGIGTISPNATLDVNGNTIVTGSLTVTGSAIITGSISTLGSSTILTSNLVSTVTSSQSYLTITGSIQQIQTASTQVYGVNIAPRMIYTTGSQTQTALKVTPTFSGSAAFSSSQQNIIADFGATSVGTQFSVNDITSGSIYMVNDVSGLPIIEALSDWTVNMYNYPTKVFQKSGSVITISGSLNISGSINSSTGSLTLTSGSVTMPNRSAFRVYGSGVTGIPATTTISGSATTVDYNQRNNYDNTTGIYTAPIAGLYHVYFNARTNSGATQQAIVYKNRVAGVGGTSMLMWETTGSNSGHFGVSSILNLAVNDTLQAVVTLGTVQFDSNDNWGAAYIG